MKLMEHVGAKTVITKIRLNYLRQAFALFLKHFNGFRKNKRNEASCDYFLQTR